MKRTYEEMQAAIDDISLGEIDDESDGVEALCDLIHRDIGLKCTNGVYWASKKLWDKIHFKKEGFADPKYEICFERDIIEAIEVIYLHLEEYFDLCSDKKKSLCCPVELYKALDYFNLDVNRGIKAWFNSHPEIEDLHVCGNSDIELLKNMAYDYVKELECNTSMSKYCVGLHQEALKEVLDKIIS